MDVSLLVHHFQYAIPVGIVLILAVLVFAFGFKNAEQPPFAQLSAVSDVDRKQANKKKNKIKEKRSSNEKANEKASPVKKSSPAKTESSKKTVAKNDEVDGKLKERKQEDNTPVIAKKDKQITNKTGKENKVEQVKNKKNMKNLILEKPVDFDEGDWEQAYSKKDKRKKKEEESPKKSKKSKKNELVDEVGKDNEPEKVEIKDKVAKETENKELKEKDQKDVILEPVDNILAVEDEQVEPKEEVKKVEKINKIEKEKEEKKTVKVKKSKKANDAENNSVSNVTPIETKPEKIIEKKIEDAPKKTEPVEKSTIEQVTEKSGPAFDELGDTWTEAKPQKKSKKKARKDN
ncbi:uncharacterized protein DDB_G0286299-like [Microplitis mediator]|uniref:uncharacterized protein DDB_G0286299-like n=1 Tax=Microplitis mediator TaxID=375433 RepID=UPI00255309C4|nr:uncharacterized protein DDB_G0286299-like [Microplitis mediator]